MFCSTNDFGYLDSYEKDFLLQCTKNYLRLYVLHEQSV
jgi:hypothetical protein